MRIEITQSQHADLIELLNAVAELYRHEAAAFSALGAIGKRLAVERLELARNASELFDHLAKF